MHNSDKEHASQGDRSQRRAYWRDFLPGIIGYAIILSVVVGSVDQYSASPWNYLWILLPVVPALWVVRAVIRYIRRADEYQRLLQLEGMATGFGVAMITSLTLGFLGVAGIATRGAGWIIYSLGMLTWLVAHARSSHRST